MALWRSVLAATLFLTNTAQGALKYKGADWSSVAVLEKDNIVEYKGLDGQVKPLESILAENGINIVRQRVVSSFFYPSITVNGTALRIVH